MAFASWQRYCTASSSGRQPKFAALNRGCHLYSAVWPSRWALAHTSSFCFFSAYRWRSIVTLKIWHQKHDHLHSSWLSVCQIASVGWLNIIIDTYQPSAAWVPTWSSACEWQCDWSCSISVVVLPGICMYSLPKKTELITRNKYGDLTTFV